MANLKSNGAEGKRRSFFLNEDPVSSSFFRSLLKKLISRKKCLHWEHFLKLLKRKLCSNNKITRPLVQRKKFCWRSVILQGHVTQKRQACFSLPRWWLCAVPLLVGMETASGTPSDGSCWHLPVASKPHEALSRAPVLALTTTTNPYGSLPSSSATKNTSMDRCDDVLSGKQIAGSSFSFSSFFSHPFFSPFGVKQ